MSFQVLIVLTKYPIQCSICFQFTMFEPLRGQKVSGQGDSVVRVSSIQVKLLISVLVLISKIEGKIKKWKTGAKSFWSDADRSPCSSGSSCSSSVGVVLHPGLPCFFIVFVTFTRIMIIRLKLRRGGTGSIVSPAKPLTSRRSNSSSTMERWNFLPFVFKTKLSTGPGFPALARPARSRLLAEALLQRTALLPSSR